MPIKPLSASKLYRRCDLSKLVFSDTSQLEDLDQVIGQERALQALEVALNIDREGYNLYALGPAGLGKHSVVKRFIEKARETKGIPHAWCYLHNFADPKRPKALSLPPGMAKQFVADMNTLVQELQAAITTALESDEFRARRDAIEEAFKDKQEKGLKEIQERARARGIAMIHTPAGIGFAPTQEGEVIRPDQFSKLSAEKKKELERVIEQLQEELQELMQSVPRQLRESRKRLQELTREAITFAVRDPIGDLQKRYAELPKVVEHLNGLREDVIEHAGDFIRGEEGSQQQAKEILGHVPGASPFDRYKVNLLVERDAAEGAPIVYEVNPTYNNLVGTIEHVSQMGALVTDFTLIKPGALHRANGGYLLLDARRLLQQPFAYEALKQALRIGKIRLESLGQALSLVSTVSLEPEPISLQVKVVLIGERMLYYLLCHYDPDFPDLFKIAADFAEEIDWDDESLPLYAQLVATLARRNEVRPLNRRATARVIEHSARMVSDSEKLSIRIESVADLLREADYWCGHQQGRVIDASHVQRAIDAQIFRNSRIRERLQQEVMRQTMLIDTQGERIGQINGLSVLQLGSYAFGKPSRISATARLGKGELLDIEREVQLGGPIHSKGVLILAGFLGARFGKKEPLALSARLVFEQSYGGVDGDSASSAELYALLSALAEAPIHQHFAVTGSVNQYGEVQAIGGVNEKIEGFFDLCKERGLTGKQGVLIPKANVKHLMLAPRVLSAVRRKQFSVYAVETIDQGIELLTGIKSGGADVSGCFPPRSINGRVQRRLRELADAARAMSAPATQAPDPTVVGSKSRERRK